MAIFEKVGNFQVLTMKVRFHHLVSGKDVQHGKCKCTLNPQTT